MSAGGHEPGPGPLDRGPRILVSACLMGAPVRYDGRAKTLVDTHLDRWRAEDRLVAFCPEVAGGLPTPRAPAEIEPGATAADVLAGTGRVLTATGEDVTAAFVEGARKALAFARSQGAGFALLIDASPSCGSSLVYDGHFAGRRVAGSGVTAALLGRSGIEVFPPARIAELAARIAAFAG